jgi:hypothetical protein
MHARAGFRLTASDILHQDACSHRPHTLMHFVTPILVMRPAAGSLDTKLCDLLFREYLPEGFFSVMP